MANNKLAYNVFFEPQDQARLLIYADFLEENNHDKLAIDLRLFGLFDTKYKIPCRYDSGSGGGYSGDGSYRHFSDISPANDTELLEPSPKEILWRSMFSRAIPANPAGWQNHINIPKNYIPEFEYTDCADFPDTPISVKINEEPE